MFLDQLRKFGREVARQFPRQRRADVAEELFKLALECGLELFTARSVRDAARAAR